MGITTIFNNGVLGLTAQSRALGTISNNIANASTSGFKASETQFTDFVLSDRSGNTEPGNGVRAFDRLDHTGGTVSQTGVTTNAAIVGNGFFVVQDMDFQASTSKATGRSNDDAVFLTRSGDFSPDKDGYLVNGAGKALMGFKLDPASGSGSFGSTDTLTAVSLSGLQDYREATTQASLNLNLPRGQEPVTGEITTANTTGVVLNLIDKDGADGAMSLRFLKTGQAEDGTSSWQVFNAGVVGADGKAVGDANVNDPTTWQPLGTLNFARNGTLTGGTTGDPMTLTLNPGGNFAQTTLDLGAYGKMNNSITSVADLQLGIVQGNNGIRAGTYQGAELTSDGFVAANFQGGKQRYIYRVPDATVVNPTDLESVSGTMFRTTAESGAIRLNSFGNLTNETGTSAPPTVGAKLSTASVEGSNVKIEEQFTTLIQAQRTYSAASKLVSTADEMTQTTITLKS
ncbi:flagellar hook protein FlgE [Azospirillum isscasi]|uniref:Flagellar hook protein FlgE n=1 Tax=Azospirillum isscasi TaxID=3053926 RepID=A0ABU0WEN4_9PROT|nr:flagellar hook-basal body complex protein [Azospirillum isscasi]MDQ2102367.1 flagellar hook-basal body complex protein [Azospirillum isscasi]